MIIMKFGGTSVGDETAIRRLINIVKSRIDKQPVVVVSAMSAITNVLYEIANLALNKELSAAKEKIELMQEKHITVSKKLISNINLFHQTLLKIDNYFSEINDAVKGIYLLSELSKQSLAKIVSYGELLSSTVIYGAMLESGLQTKLLDAREFIFTSDNFLNGEANIEMIKEKVPDAMKIYIDAGYVPLTQGFIASIRKGITNTLGRGGSDYTASLLGMALNADEIEIWTDVDGIMTTDPKKVSTAKIIPKISFEEASELAFFGAKVIHPMTIKPAMDNHIPVKILNSMNYEKPGSVILSDSNAIEKGITAIAFKEKIKVLNIFSLKMLHANGFLKKVFEVFEQNNTSVDVIATSEVNISLTLDNEEYLNCIVAALSEFSKVDIIDDKSLVCIVGKNLRNITGITNRIFRAVRDFNITMISMGGSLINMNIVVDREALSDIVRALHDEFF